jgi:hypothetical protein
VLRKCRLHYLFSPWNGADAFHSGGSYA